jgi:deoxyribose-phosphate aldolase
MNISKNIDYTLLESTATERDIIQLCENAITHNYHSVCINNCYVALAKQILNHSSVKISTVIGFPLGGISTKAKVYEAKQAIADGADEIGMVINLGYLKSKNYVSVLKDISDVKFAIGNIALKVIIEISELNKNEIIKTCGICLDANADYIETSSGFSKNGATLTAVKIIKKTIKNFAKIKATGTIEDYDTALKYIEAGADIIGTRTLINPSINALLARNSEIYKHYIENAETPEIDIANKAHS